MITRLLSFTYPFLIHLIVTRLCLIFGEIAGYESLECLPFNSTSSAPGPVDSHRQMVFFSAHILKSPWNDLQIQYLIEQL